MTDEEHTFTTRITTVCRGCGKLVTAGFVDGDEHTGTPTLLHRQQPCAEFLRLDVVDFLRWNRGATEN